MHPQTGLLRHVAALAVVSLAVGSPSTALAQDAPAGLRQRAGDLAGRLDEVDATRLEALLTRAATAGALPAGVAYLARFPGPVPGLQVGAPVLAQGVRVGTVRGVAVAFATGTAEVTASVAVTFDIVPHRVVLDGVPLTSEEALRAAVDALVGRGLRVRVAGGGFPLGAAVVELVLDPAAAPPVASAATDASELPTLPPEPDRVRVALERLLARLATLPLEQMGEDLAATTQALRELAAAPELRAALASLAATADMLPGLAARLEPEATAALAVLGDAARAARVAAERATVTIASLDGTMGPKAPLWSDLRSVLREVDGATRGLRLLLEYLERHPDALIRGRTGAAP